MTQVDLIHAYLRNSTHGASLRELIFNAKATWPTHPRTLASSVCRYLHNHCAESHGFKGKQNLFCFREVHGRKIWFARDA